MGNGPSAEKTTTAPEPDIPAPIPIRVGSEFTLTEPYDDRYPLTVEGEPHLVIRPFSMSAQFCLLTVTDTRTGATTKLSFSRDCDAARIGSYVVRWKIDRNPKYASTSTHLPPLQPGGAARLPTPKYKSSRSRGNSDNMLASVAAGVRFATFDLSRPAITPAVPSLELGVPIELTLGHSPRARCVLSSSATGVRFFMTLKNGPDVVLLTAEDPTLSTSNPNPLPPPTVPTSATANTTAPNTTATATATALVTSTCAIVSPPAPDFEPAAVDESGFGPLPFELRFTAPAVMWGSFLFTRTVRESARRMAESIEVRMECVQLSRDGLMAVLEEVLGRDVISVIGDYCSLSPSRFDFGDYATVEMGQRTQLNPIVFHDPTPPAPAHESNANPNAAAPPAAPGKAPLPPSALTVSMKNPYRLQLDWHIPSHENPKSIPALATTTRRFQANVHFQSWGRAGYYAVPVPVEDKIPYPLIIPYPVQPPQEPRRVPLKLKAASDEKKPAVEYEPPRVVGLEACIRVVDHYAGTAVTDDSATRFRRPPSVTFRLSHQSMFQFEFNLPFDLAVVLRHAIVRYDSALPRLYGVRGRSAAAAAAFRAVDATATATATAVAATASDDAAGSGAWSVFAVTIRADAQEPTAAMKSDPVQNAPLPCVEELEVAHGLLGPNDSELTSVRPIPVPAPAHPPVCTGAGSVLDDMLITKTEYGRVETILGTLLIRVEHCTHMQRSTVVTRRITVSPPTITATSTATAKRLTNYSGRE